MALRLREWRKNLKLTQLKLAERLSIDIGVLRKYENGINVPGGRVLASLGDTGVNLNWLLTGDGQMDARQPSNTDFQWSDNPELTRRLTAIAGLLDDIGEEKRSAVLDEIFSRVQEAKRVADLEDLVTAMTKKLA
jgi:transcriptional regulator with XRE-family HTH domain